MKQFILLLLVFVCTKSTAQELFVYTEPASNMSAKSIGVRIKNTLQKEKHSGKNIYTLNPEMMLGISKNIMIHADGFLNTKENQFSASGGSLYLKYRFFSTDDVHSHFRLAAFGRYAFSNDPIHDYAIDLYGNNTGYEGGVVATKLVNKIALAAGSSFLHADNNGGNKFLYNNKLRNAVNYTFSAGKLMLPKEYVNYNQTNVNLMAEFLGQVNAGDGSSYLDIAPSVQFIFNSRIRIDLGYRYPIVSNLQRNMSKGGLIRVEYNFFNAFK